MTPSTQPDLLREERGEYRLTPEQQAEKEVYRARLRAFLEDPTSRQIEGYPIGEIDDILALSDPPYYTACPNPFLAEILAKWQQERGEAQAANRKSKTENPKYHREPFAADVSEGKNDPIYNAHSYHTKVPHKAIMRYILHYTEPGDIIFDGFCGTGMTGVAAQLCGDKKTVESLGYRVAEDGSIYDTPPSPPGKGAGGEVRKPISKLGPRKTVLVDLSPAATFIAYNYNTPVDARAFEEEARRILDEVDKECGWMYETWHVPPIPRPLPPHRGEGEQGVPPIPSPEGEGEQDADVERWDVPELLHRKMVEVARQFRKQPTHSEAILWNALRGKKLDGVKFRRQQPIGAFVVDFYASTSRLIVEVDGSIHAEQQELDRQRQDLLESLGLRMLRLPASLVEDNLETALAAIRSALQKTAPTPTVPSPLVGEGSGVGGVGSRVGEGPGVGGVGSRVEGVKGRINYTVWSDVFTCPGCGGEVIFWEAAVDHENDAVRSTWPCPACGASLAKTPPKGSDALRAERAFETVYDRALGQTIRCAKQVPVLINYSVGKRRYEKRPDADDLALLQEIEDAEIPCPFPTDALPDGYNTQQPRESHGVTHVHHFYTHRNLWILAALWNKATIRKEIRERLLLGLWLTSQHVNLSKLNRYRPNVSFPYNPLSGTLYISSQVSEANPFTAYENRVSRLIQAIAIIQTFQVSNTNIHVQSSTVLQYPDNNIDYVFIDPPFGGNLMYSELNFLWEAWLSVFTSNRHEAIVNNVQRKGLSEYHTLMEACFREFYRVLKPGHWMTVEFHNSANSVWNSIQEGLLRAGFMVADVRTLDKQQGTFKQVTSSAAVKQDLIISAYKPNNSLEERFRLEAGTADGAWNFVRYHLGQLPRVVEKDGALEVVAERQAYLLFDRMVAFHIQRGASVPLSASEFYAGLKQRFAERDGMYFLPDQVAEYDAARLRLGRVAQLALFVSDEKTAIQWLRQQLEPSLGGKPQTFAELQPQFMREGHKASHEQMPELSEMLEQNFLEDEHGHWYPPNPSKASDLERLRQRALLKEFATYLEGRGRLRQFRTEAVRAGFAEAYRDKKYAVILQIAARLPEDMLHEDPDLLMYFDTATLRTVQ